MGLTILEHDDDTGSGILRVTIDTRRSLMDKSWDIKCSSYSIKYINERVGVIPQIIGGIVSGTRPISKVTVIAWPMDMQ